MVLVLLLVAFFSAVLPPCFAIGVNVTRSQQDTFSVTNCTICANFNQATCIRKGVCQCPRFSSTFFIHKKHCDSPSNLVDDNDCLRWFHKKLFLKVIDLTSSSLEPFLTTYSLCRVRLGTKFEYLGRHQGDWKKLSLQGGQPVFSIEKNQRKMALKVSGNNDLLAFAGRIIRVNLLCKGSKGERNTCLIMKSSGTVSTTWDVSPSQTSTSINQDVGISTSTSTSTAERTKATATEQPSSPKYHYIGSQSKPHFTPSPSNSTVVSQVRINGAVTVDKSQKKGDPVVVAIISVLGAIACSLVISAVLAWFAIKYYKKFRRQEERITSPSTAFSNQVMQDAIPMSTTATAEPEPVYSELRYVVESANGIRSDPPVGASIPTKNEEDFFIIRNPLQYNTLPRARKLTDPLPIPPPVVRPMTPDLRMLLRTNVHPNATKTAEFLSKVSKQLGVSRYHDDPRTRRKRSATDVNTNNVFFENIPAKGLVVDVLGTGGNQPTNKGAQPLYQDLSEADKGSRISVYEPLERATIQPADVRKTTLERISDQENTENELECSLDDSVPEYHILEPSTEDEAHNHDVDTEKSYPGTLCMSTDNKTPCAPSSTEHDVNEGPSKQSDHNYTNHELHFEAYSSVDSGSKQVSGIMFNGEQNIRLSDSQDWSSLGLHRALGKTSERIYLRRRAKSLDF